ncbi:WhiB family transcriptional regulator [Williamsia muralis]|uniref:WhiB family transcriptional regulator n=1 Tax=Williamsia marianensis TaxID=85044 RepID=UPI00380EB56A
MSKDTATDAIVSRYRTQKPLLPPPVTEHWDWQRGAICRVADITMFYPSNACRGQQRELLEARAKSLCHRCPVLTECRDHALETGEPYGVWGGTTPRERALIRHRTLAE